jgi:hypothetical protein
LNGKYCFEIGEVYSQAIRNASDTETADLTGMALANQVAREQCMFEALQGEKSHWFRFMDTLIEGCIRQKMPFLNMKAQLVTDDCFDKAVKIS